jgi:hypothetical protein
VTECQGCGAWNDTSRTLCVLCGTSLAETDEWDAAAELPPLPPLPDGGLAASMPTWLREPPPLSPAPALAAEPHQAPAALGPRADPRTFLSDDDFPRWLRDLAARRVETARPPAVQSGTSLVSWANWPESPEAALGAPSIAFPVAQEVAPSLVDTANDTTGTSLPTGAARAVGERREREVWETLLLVFLFIGVIVAALWALVANGVFSPGL